MNRYQQPKAGRTKRIWPCRKKFVRAMAQRMGEGTPISTPLELYNWFIEERDHPLNEERRRQAYMAAWAVFIENGLVQL